MSSLQEYCRKMSTEQLEDILRNDLEGVVRYPTEVILTICAVLAERNPEKRDAREAYERFLINYASE